MRLLAFLGRGFLLLATMAFITGVSLFVIGAYLATWPIMRVSPRNARLQSLSDLALAGLGVMRAFENVRPSPPKSAPSNGVPGQGE